jgi:UDP-N-acetylglucosamine--N-acetylmuramyl-(pentapeptide) pyrophosphoryl-undecaprenol N-acetylglucosamine transferase
VSGCFAVTAGGTGGHLFPAEALARELLSLGRAVHLVTDERIDIFGDRVFGAEVHRLRAVRLTGSPAQAVRGLATLAAGLVQARRLLRQLSPAAVIGFGGYPSVPTMAAAAYLRLPIMIHEQNAVLGRANRRLAPHARRIATGFPTSAGVRPTDRAKCVHTGNPVRRAVLAIGDREYRAPEPGRPIELLILGGSQGARVLSEVVPPALAALPSRLREPLRVSQQVRSEDFAAVAEVYRRHRIAAELSSFFEDVPARLARANLAICRAGASTVSELAAAGRPAVLIPYPHAADDHQTANARSFVEVGGGWVIPQSDLSPDILAVRLGTLLSESAALIAAAERARSFSRRDATQRLARLVLDLEPHTDCGAGPPGRAA